MRYPRDVVTRRDLPCPGPGRFCAVDDPRRYVRAAETVAARIRGGEYESGRRLDVGLLAAELGVSRRTIGHALEVLAARGLVQRFEGLGWFVA